MRAYYDVQSTEAGSHSIEIRNNSATKTYATISWSGTGRTAGVTSFDYSILTETPTSKDNPDDIYVWADMATATADLTIRRLGLELVSVGA